MTLSALAGFELPLRHAWYHQKVNETRNVIG